MTINALSNNHYEAKISHFKKEEAKHGVDIDWDVGYYMGYNSFKWLEFKVKKLIFNFDL